MLGLDVNKMLDLNLFRNLGPKLNFRPRLCAKYFSGTTLSVRPYVTISESESLFTCKCYKHYTNVIDCNYKLNTVPLYEYKVR